jgi:hypothetical protein
MSKITLDSTMSDQLRQFKEPVELIDPRGFPPGTFTPVDDRRLYREIEIPFSTEELKRFESEPGGRTLDKILADLDKPS